VYIELFSQNLVIREWLNGSLLPLTANLAFIIGVYLYQAYQYGKSHGFTWTRLEGVPTACALFWVFLAESIRAGFVWILLRTTNDGFKVSPDFETFSNVSLIFGAAILVASVLRCTYIFTPPYYRRVYWVFSLVTTVSFLIVSHIFPDYPSITH
jgi:hypothetical protein